MLDTNHLLVIGAGPGMGSALARRFAAGGYRMTLAARDETRLTAMAGQLLTDSGDAPATLVLDASDPAALTTRLAAWVAERGTPDALVYNAAALQQDGLSALSPPDLERTLRLNVTSAVAALQMVLPAMRDDGRGCVVFTGGGLALSPSPAYGSLSVGKSALRTAALVLGEELRGEGIHVATVTIAALIAAGTPGDPDVLAGHYWDLVHEPPGRWRHEVVVPGVS